MQDKKNKSIVSTDITGLKFDEESLKKAIKFAEKRKKLMDNYIRENLVEGVDYGSIEMKLTNKQTGEKYTVNTKNILFKPGAEKITSLYGLRSKWIADEETFKMLDGKQNKTYVCYKCLLLNNQDKIVGEGRGACSLEEKSGDANVAIKIAKKRAKLDAILDFAALSETFTQDLDEMETPSHTTEPKKSKKQKVENEAVEEDQKPKQYYVGIIGKYKTALENVISETDDKEKKVRIDILYEKVERMIGIVTARKWNDLKEDLEKMKSALIDIS
jgi:uncharacterized protein YheU (UPF0270 family)